MVVNDHHPTQVPKTINHIYTTSIFYSSPSLRIRFVCDIHSNNLRTSVQQVYLTIRAEAENRHRLFFSTKVQSTVVLGKRNQIMPILYGTRISFIIDITIYKASIWKPTCSMLSLHIGNISSGKMLPKSLQNVRFNPISATVLNRKWLHVHLLFFLQQCEFRVQLRNTAIYRMIVQQRTPVHHRAISIPNNREACWAKTVLCPRNAYTLHILTHFVRLTPRDCDGLPELPLSH